MSMLSVVDVNLFTLVTSCTIAWMLMKMISRRPRPGPVLPPGPTGLPIVGMLPFLDPQLHTYFARLARTHGPLMSLRVGQKTAIVVTSPSVAKHMLHNMDLIFANHDVTLAGRELSYGGNDVLFTSYGPQWRMLRKAMVDGMLGPGALETARNLRTQCVHTTIVELKRQVGNHVNIGEHMFLMALNVITSAIWGKSSAKGKEMMNSVEFRREVNNGFELVAAPNVSDFFPALARFDLQRVVKKARDCSRKLDDIIDSVIGERITQMGEKTRVDNGEDFLHFLLRSKDQDDEKTRISMPQIKVVLTDMILAGTDTASSTLEFAMDEMMKNPEAMRRAQEEVEEVVGNGNLVEEFHISQLPYLQAIMKETLRLHPTVPLLAPHRPSESCVIEGYTIPKGSYVLFNVWAIHRDPSLWEEPLKFKPERFHHGKHDFRGRDFSYFPFGSGRRICVGIALAEKMILLSLASLLHHFDWNFPKDVEGGGVGLPDKFGSTLKRAIPLILVPSLKSSYVQGNQQCSSLAGHTYIQSVL